MAAKSAPTGQDAVGPTAVEPLPVQPVAPVPEKPAKGSEPAPDMLWREHEERLQMLEKREPPPAPVLPAAPPLPGPQDRPGGRLFPDFVYDLLD